MKYDFSGWATRANVYCTDGRTIMPDAFKDDDGKRVPLVWNHDHNSPGNVLGHADLENRGTGVYARCAFNDTEMGRNARELVKHGDIVSLSIYANQLKQNGSAVVHGTIREVSLVLAGANKEAFIDSVLSHGSDSEEEGVIYMYTGGNDISLSHADEEKEDSMDENKKKTSSNGSGEETVGEVFNTLTEKQKTVVYALIGQALEDAKGGKKDDDEEEGDSVKHNAFSSGADGYGGNYLSHSDFQQLMSDAKRCGSLREAIQDNMESGVLAHMDIDTTGMTTATGTQTYGFNDPDMLYPDYRSLNTPPEWLSRDMGWVKRVINGVHHTPFSRIKSMFANITEDEARARGYIKGNEKREQVFTTLKRTTDPQTIYKKQRLDRDDIVDITDFDVVAWIKAEMRVMLEEEIARAILIGDGRSSDSDDKIQETHVRPIATDVPLFNTQVKISVASDADEAVIAKATINGAIRARKNYKGSGNPTFFTTEDVVTEMLLLEDGFGHKLYKTEGELATALRANSIVTVEPMEGHSIAISGANYPLIGVMVNLADYNVGADKGGAINTFEDFDIDFNQQKYLIETRISGALIKPFSALTLVLDKAA